MEDPQVVKSLLNCYHVDRWVSTAHTRSYGFFRAASFPVYASRVSAVSVSVQRFTLLQTSLLSFYSGCTTTPFLVRLSYEILSEFFDSLRFRTSYLYNYKFIVLQYDEILISNRWWNKVAIEHFQIHIF